MQKFALLLILALSAIQCGAVSESALRKSSQERQLWGSSSSSSGSSWTWWDYLTMHLCHLKHHNDHEDHCPSPPHPHHSSGGGSHSSGGGGGGGSDDSTHDCGTCYGDDCDECEEGDDECTCECECSWGDDGHTKEWGDDGHVEEWGDDGHEDDDTWEDDGHDDDGEDDGIWANDGHDDDEYWGSDGYSEQYVNAASSGNYSAENGSSKRRFWGIGLGLAALVAGLAFLVTRKRKRNQNNDVPQDVYVDADNMNNRGDDFRNDPQSVEMQTMNTGKISRAQSFKSALSMKSMQLRNKFRRSPANVPDGNENLAAYGGNGAYDAPAAFDHESINSHEQGGVVM